MRQLTRTASVWAFSALFGCISLFGSGWHCFVGHAFHGPAAGHADCAEHEHDHDCASTHEHATDEQHSGAVAVHDHDCPLCQFFAQAQWNLTLESVETGAAVSDAASHAGQSGRAVRIASYRSRAPPGSPLS
jgi:hypothetical protein